MDIFVFGGKWPDECEECGTIAVVSFAIPTEAKAVIVYIDDTHDSNGNSKVRERHNFKFLKMQIFKPLLSKHTYDCTLMWQWWWWWRTQARTRRWCCSFFALNLHNFFFTTTLSMCFLFFPFHSSTFAHHSLSLSSHGRFEISFCIAKAKQPVSWSLKYKGTWSMYLVEQVNDEHHFMQTNSQSRLSQCCVHFKTCVNCSLL